MNKLQLNPVLKSEFSPYQKTGQFFVVGCDLFITFAVRFRKHSIAVKFLMANFQ